MHLFFTCLDYLTLAFLILSITYATPTLLQVFFFPNIIFPIILIYTKYILQTYKRRQTNTICRIQ